jgi:hypothetical protein
VPALLRQLLTAEETGKPHLAVKLRNVLADPRELLNCGILHEEHRLYINALAVEDAFEAVTNGMENPTALERLSEVPDDSIVGPWKLCVFALKALYDGDIETLRSAASKIPEGAPPAHLANLALRIAGGQLLSSEKRENRESAVLRFIDELVQSPDFVAAAGEQLEEALAMGMTDLYADTAVMLVRDLERDYPAAVADFAVWCFARLAEEDESLQPLIKRFKAVFGEAETLRLAALGIVKEDADAALFYWLRFTAAALSEDRLNRLELSAALRIAADIGVQGLLPFGTQEEELGEDEALLQRQIVKLLARVQAESGLRFRELRDFPLLHPEDCREAALVLTAEESLPPLLFRSLETGGGSRGKEENGAEGREPMQLELFA